MKRLTSVLSVAVFLAIALLVITSLVLPVSAAQAADEPECWGVFVGVSNYQYINDLSYCDDDAEELYGVFSPVWGSDHTRLLTDSQATKAAILDAIQWLADNADSNDTVMFTFSGHGSNYGVGYFFPYNSLTYSYNNAISAAELESAFMPVAAEKTVIILDICYAGTFEGEMAQPGRVILMACRSSQTSMESGWLGNGVYSYYIIEALTNFGDADTNGDYVLSAEEIAAYAYQPTYDYFHWQNPVISDNYADQLALLAMFVFHTSLPSGNQLITIDGIPYTAFPNSLLWIPGTSHIIVIPDLVDNGAGTRWVFTGWNDGESSLQRIISNGLFTANYNKEYLLTLITSYGSTTGDGWYVSGSSASFTITPYIETADTKRYFTGWSGSYSGTLDSDSIVMNSPKTLTASWRNEYLLTINSEYGAPTGAGWYDEGASASISVEEVQGFIIRHIFDGWSGDLTASNTSANVTMNNPKVITATWHSDYLQLYILIAVVVVVAAGVIVTVILIRRRNRTKNAIQ